MISYTECPVCNGKDIIKVFSVKDYTVSSELFEIWQCNLCTVRFTQNVPSENEIGSYYQSPDYISHSDTKKGFINTLYHYVRKKTLVSKRNMIRKYTGTSSGKILDIGAGTGAFLHTMYNDGWDVSGIEPDEQARNKAMELYGIDLKQSTQLFDLPPDSYDAITMWHVIEHVHQLHEYIDQLKKLLKIKGCLFIAVPNYKCYDAKVYKEFWAGYDVPRHLYHFSPKSMTQLLLKHGLQLRNIKRMWYDSFYVSMLSEKYKTGKNNYFNACLTGYISNWRALFDREQCSSLIYVVTK